MAAILSRTQSVNSFMHEQTLDDIQERTILNIFS